VKQKKMWIKTEGRKTAAWGKEKEERSRIKVKKS